MTDQIADRHESAVDSKLLEILVCPLTKGPLEFDAARQELISRKAKLAYPIRDGIPIMLPEEARANRLTDVRLEMLKVWGRNNSSNVQKVMWAIGEMGLAHERVDIGGPFGGNDQPPYLAMNPNGVVPTLEEDDGFILWESNSIVRYLAAKHGAGTLEPADPQTRFSAQRWMDWQLAVTTQAITPMFWGLVRTPPDKRDPVAIEAGKVRCLDALRIMEAQLAKTRFLAGDAFSYGDIPVGPFVYRCFRLIPDRPPLPNVERWYGEIAARPPFRQHVLEIAFT